MLTFELPSDEYRRRLRHALLKDLGDMKALRKKNVEEEVDVSDIDYKITLIDGGKGGTPGLLQIFSGSPLRLLWPNNSPCVERRCRLKMRSSKQRIADEKGGRKWVEWVPSPRPKAGERVRALDGESLLVIIDSIGWQRIDGKNADKDTTVDEALFAVWAVPIAKAEGFTPDDKQRVFLKTDSVRDEIAEWTQVPSPVDVGEIREAVRAGIENGEDFDGAPDDQSTVTELGAFGSGEPSTEFDQAAENNGRALESAGFSPPPVDAKEGNNSGKPRGRKRAAAGNLAGAVKNEVARATGERKVSARKGGKK
jgi:hypothetical protein